MIGDIGSKILDDWNKSMEAYFNSFKFQYIQRIQEQMQDLVRNAVQPLIQAQDFIRKFAEPFQQMIRKMHENIKNSFIGRLWRKLRLVVDANYIIANVLGLIKWGKSELLRLFDNPYFIAYAPNKVVNEVEGHLIKIAKKKGVDENILLSTFRNQFLPKINLIDPDNSDVERAKIVVKEHSKDAEYVGLIFSVNTDGFLTKENRFSHITGIRRWIVSEADEVSWKLNPFGSLIRSQEIIKQITEQQKFIYDNLFRNMRISLNFQIPLKSFILFS